MHILHLVILRAMTKNSHEFLLLCVSSILRLLHSLKIRASFRILYSRSAFFLDFETTLTILDMINHLSIGMSLLTAWALELQNIHKIF